MARVLAEHTSFGTAFKPAFPPSDVAGLAAAPVVERSIHSAYPQSLMFKPLAESGLGRTLQLACGWGLLAIYGKASHY